jgi:hypothetical protein
MSEEKVEEKEPSLATILAIRDELRRHNPFSGLGVENSTTTLVGPEDRRRNAFIAGKDLKRVHPTMKPVLLAQIKAAVVVKGKE